MRMLSLLSLILFLTNLSPALAQSRPVYAAPDHASVNELLAETSVVRALTEAELLALVPEQSGLHYVGCPNCQSGRQENQLTWSIDRPDVVTCQYCQHDFPSSKYPMSKSVKVRTPSHGQAEYPYWEDATGYRFFFEAKRDDLKKRFMADQAYKLAWLYQRTGDEAYARRALLILSRFADVFPNWCFHYDYPFRQKEIEDGPVSPAQFRPGYRTARWTWWAYSDIPIDLIKAYDWLAASRSLAELKEQKRLDVAQHIQHDLFLAACQQVLDNQETYTNMSPRAWLALTTAGRVLKKPEYVHHVMRCSEELVVKNFFYDGTWCEGSPDYEHQTVEGLRNIIEALGDYEDPEGYIDPVDGLHYDALSKPAKPGQTHALKQTVDTLRLALNSERMLLPDGRSVPVHDTWPDSRRKPPTSNASRLWPGLGHARLSSSQADTKASPANITQLHMTWSGGYGHSHADNLSLLLYSGGREVLSDLGYTHTAYRGWTLATVAHNTVVIDGLNQTLGNRNQPSDGRLLYSQLNDDRFNVVMADGSRGYPGLAKRYTRSVMMVTTPNVAPYMVDVFEVDGGKTHDYFLHGWADGPAHLSASVATQPRASLIENPENWVAPKNEGQSGMIAKPHYAYGFLKSLKSAAASQPLTVDFQCAASQKLAASTSRVHLFPEAHSELVLGENPSIRQAREDDARLEQFQRPFMMLRHHSDGISRFVSVIEEFAGQAGLRKVENLSTDKRTVLKIELESSPEHPERPTCQWVLLDVREPMEILCAGAKLIFQGQLGFLSCNDKLIDRVSCSGSASWRINGQPLITSSEEHAQVAPLVDRSLTLDKLRTTAPVGTALLQTTDGWTYPISIQACAERDGRPVVTAPELQAFAWDASRQRLSGKLFPQREHSGAVTLRWFTQACRSDIDLAP